MALQGVAEGARSHIPEAYGVVATATGQDASVPTERHAVDLARVALQGAVESACGYIPEAYGVVVAATGQGLRVRTECHAVDLSRVPCEQ